MYIRSCIELIDCESSIKQKACEKGNDIDDARILNDDDWQSLSSSPTKSDSQCKLIERISSSFIGKALTEYVAEESTIPAYMALHLASECARLGSVAPKHFVPHVKPPPRLQVSSDAQEPDEEKHGSLASGKSTLIKTLATWAVKSGRTKVKGPGLLLVNLNPNDVGWTVPGTFSVAPLDVLIPTTTPVLPFGSTPTTEYLKHLGEQYTHAYCVDNCLVKVADPIFLGYCIGKKIPCGVKFVLKSQPNKSLGVLALKNKHWSVVSFEFKLAYHIADKNIPHIDLKSKELIKPNQPNGIKLELFIFDFFPFVNSLSLLEVDRIK
ncbi:Cleavage polyadenylation factor subunit clp1 [Puccinia graminis f. sp. tritici]|uniref:UDP-N-acetylglucosamine diphosphorylase n=1 Tax=Puccinia graminis f. sp. tritici TaxID=56615 RepID=A0A5B0NGR9_PUCGR|nr:Cleavage polyadenylation factor subunit clp1 [Puccinia graminis f. sp. tritici]